MPGRVTINGVVLDFPGLAVDLAAFNNDTAYVWVFDSGGVPTIGFDSDANGWPATPHLKLVEVTLATGLIASILDRRSESVMSRGIDAALAASLATYTAAIATQGGIGSPSTVTVTLSDAYGNVINAVDTLRVRVCDSGGYATIAPGTNTTTVETITAGKDLIL